MGWTSRDYPQASHKEFAQDMNCIEAFIRLDAVPFGYSCSAVYLHPDSVQHEMYLLMQNEATSRLFVMVILIKIEKGEIYYKCITEQEGPSYHNCPIEYLENSKSFGEISEKWRAKVIQNGLRL